MEEWWQIWDIDPLQFQPTWKFQGWLHATACAALLVAGDRLHVTRPDGRPLLERECVPQFEQFAQAFASFSGPATPVYDTGYGPDAEGLPDIFWHPWRYSPEQHEQFRREHGGVERELARDIGQRRMDAFEQGARDYREGRGPFTRFGGTKPCGHY